MVHRSFDRDFTCRADLSSIFFLYNLNHCGTLWYTILKLLIPYTHIHWRARIELKMGFSKEKRKKTIILGLSEESTPVWESVKGCVLLTSIVFMHRIVKKKWNWKNKQVMSYFNWRNTWCQSLTWTVLSVPMWNAEWFRNVILVKGGKETWWSSELSH